MFVCVYIYIYMYLHKYKYVYIYIYIYVWISMCIIDIYIYTSCQDTDFHVDTWKFLRLPCHQLCRLFYLLLVMCFKYRHWSEAAWDTNRYTVLKHCWHIAQNHNIYIYTYTYIYNIYTHKRTADIYIYTYLIAKTQVRHLLFKLVRNQHFKVLRLKDSVQRAPSTSCPACCLHEDIYIYTYIFASVYIYIYVPWRSWTTVSAGLTSHWKCWISDICIYIYMQEQNST